MDLVYTLTFEDHVDFQRHHAGHFSSLKRQRLLGLTVGPLAVFVGALFFLQGMDKGVVMLVGLVGAVVEVGLVCLLWRMWPKRAARRSLRGKDRGHLLGETRLQICATDIRHTDSTGESSIAWSDIDRVESGEGALYIYVQPDVAILVPGRALVEGVRERIIALAEPGSGEES